MMIFGVCNKERYKKTNAVGFCLYLSSCLSSYFFKTISLDFFTNEENADITSFFGVGFLLLYIELNGRHDVELP